MVLLTSFKKSKQLNKNWRIFSVARFQPKGFDYPALEFLAAEDANGKALSVNDLERSADKFAEALKEAYRARWSQISEWIDGLNPDKKIALACWCPYSKNTQEQLSKHGSFACHSGLIGQMIKKARPDISVVCDDDRKVLIPQWHPHLNVPVEKLTIEEFETSGRAIKVFSDVLNETFYIAATDDVAQKLGEEGHVVYTGTELKVLPALSPEGVKIAHMAKTVFNMARVVGYESNK